MDQGETEDRQSGPLLAPRSGHDSGQGFLHGLSGGISLVREGPPVKLCSGSWSLLQSRTRRYHITLFLLPIYFSVLFLLPHHSVLAPHLIQCPLPSTTSLCSCSPSISVSFSFYHITLFLLPIYFSVLFLLSLCTGISHFSRTLALKSCLSCCLGLLRLDKTPPVPGAVVSAGINKYIKWASLVLSGKESACQ